MVELGEVRKAKELGKTGNELYVWWSCSGCNEQRWVRKRNVNRLCPKCARAKVTIASRVRDSRGRLMRSENDAIVKHASEVGFHPVTDYLVYWDKCPTCGIEMWRKISYRGKPCIQCARKDKSNQLRNQRGENHPRYKGYRKMHSGYVMVKLPDEHPFRCMASARDAYVMEHRLVMAESLGRALYPWEVVHHINGIKDDNRFENLVRYPVQAEHLVTQRLNKLEQDNEELKKDNEQFKKDNIANKLMIKQLQEANAELSRWLAGVEIDRIVEDTG